jgi:hypothetical protein
MKSAGWMALLLVIAASVGGWAQCGCGDPETPICYLTFPSNETIEFSLVAPVDYFVCQETTVSPGILGWRVHAWDGTVVRSVVYPGEPKGRWMSMVWDLYDDSGYLVPPGYYRIVVLTTDGDVSYPVRILERCRPCCGCFCWWAAPPACDVPCRIPYGELYLSLGVGETRSCYGLSFSLTFRFECAEP